ncbi:MAG TPA: arsenate reductase (azurin) small subunit [Myxococcaceae bacterium]|jgi:arsenite oxidase small subunit|nr:arsenate reductase (azurin) small subunit [Myxococcaceae bacterium]
MNRREFVKVAVVTTAAAGVPASALAGIAGRTYAPARIAKVSQLAVGVPVSFNYPDAQSPALLVKLGRSALGGVGPAGDIVAFSALCTHMGCPVQLQRDHFLCPCHYSKFDPALNGQAFQGLATQYLPQIRLRIDEATQEIVAEGVDGLVWGRIENA